MAYQTGTATGIADLLDKLGAFVAANGGTQNRRDANSLSIAKGACYQNYFDNTSEIWMSASTGYNAGAAWDAQPGASTNVQKSRQMGGSFTAYHLFLGNDYIHVVVEVDPGLYRHLSAGQLAKPSNYNGGRYAGCVGFRDDGVLRNTLFLNLADWFNPNYLEGPTLDVDIEGQNGWKKFNRASDNAAELLLVSTDHGNLLAPSDDYYLYSDIFQYCTPNTLNGISPFAPIECFVRRTGGFISPLGYVKDLRIVNLTNFAPGQSETIGSNDWLIFPASVKGSGLYGTGNYGYAYKKVP
jgi:hypothetical protein